MKKKDILFLIKSLEKYKEKGLGNDPFKFQNMVWASGFEYFLCWLKEDSGVSSKRKRIKKLAPQGLIT